MLLVNVQCQHWRPEIIRAVAKANIPVKDVKVGLHNHTISIYVKPVNQSALAGEIVPRPIARALKCNAEVTASW